jgi:hypothetical protein
MQARRSYREATLAAPQYAMIPGHCFAHIPGAVHHNRPRRGIAIAGIQSLETNSLAMAADIHVVRPVGTG